MWDACLGDLLVGYIFKHYLHRIRIFCLIAKVLIVIQIMEPKPTNKRPLSKISGWYFCHIYINKMEVKFTKLNFDEPIRALVFEWVNNFSVLKDREGQHGR